MAIAVPGSLLLSSVLEDGTRGPPVDLVASADGSNVTLRHAGGDSLAVDDASVFLRRNGSETETSLAAWSLSPDADGRFEPAERAAWTHGLDAGPVEVVVVHWPTEGVVLDETVEVPGATPAPNDPPTASFTVSCDGPTCTFDAGGSDDADGSIASYHWTFGDGDEASGETTSHDYDAGGTYEVRLTVVDDDGAAGQVSQQVAVSSPRPTITGVTVHDRSANSNTDYRVEYNVTNRTAFQEVTVEFDDRAHDHSDATRTNASPRGYVEYGSGGTMGDTFDVTVRAYNHSGAVTDSVTVTDVADGDDSSEGNLSDPSGTEFAGVVVDDVSASEAAYEVSYDVTNRSEFDRVRVTVENLDSGGADATYTSTDPRDNVDDYVAESVGGTFGDGYRVTAELLDSSGVVVDEVVVTDTADGTDPAGNDDLSRAGSPTLSNWAVADDSGSSSGAVYDVTYAANDTAEYAGVEVIFRNRDNPSASGTSALSTAPSGTISHQVGGGDGDQYELEIRVVDADGIVVDEVPVSDVADGTDPGGGNPPSSPSGPAFAGVAVDDVGTTRANYEVSYDVTNRSEFDHVEVEFENLDGGGADATYTSTDPRHNVDQYSGHGGTWGHSYRITLRLVDTAGFVVDEVVVDDAADGTDPAGNDDLSRAGSPTLSSFAIDDGSGGGASYHVSYAATATAEFAGVELVFRNRDNPDASETTAVFGSSSGGYTHGSYGGGNQYEIEIRVIDADGIVVDEVIVSDVADGTDP